MCRCIKCGQLTSAMLVPSRARHSIAIGNRAMPTGGSSSSAAQRNAEGLPQYDAEWVAGVTAPEVPEDEWFRKADIWVREHNRPRHALFMPAEFGEPPPVALGDIDVTRTTSPTRHRRRSQDRGCAGRY